MKAAKEVKQEYERSKDQSSLDFGAETQTGFGYALLRELNEHLHPNSLSRLAKGSIYSKSFVRDFYSTLENLKKLKRYCRD